MCSRSLTIVGARRPFPGETMNGDAWIAHQRGDVLRLSVIDGLGHGPDAARAAEAALACLDEVAATEPGEVIRRCHEALRKTRGAVMLVMSIDPNAGRLSFAGVG